MSTVIHHSEVCACEQCRWANRQVHHQYKSQAAENGRASLWADAAIIRAAIADVLDTGYRDKDGYERAWLFLLNESDEETNRRGEFLDAVIARIRILQPKQ